MQVHEIFILVAAVGGLLGGAVFLMVGAFQWNFPKGRRVKRQHLMGLVHVVFHDNDVQEAFVGAATKAVRATAEAWERERALGHVYKNTSEIEETVVWLAPPEHIDAMRQQLGLKTLSGYIDRVGAKRLGGVFRDTLPMAVISPHVVDTAIKTGEPVIHEMLHALLRDYSGDAMDHSNPNVWLDSANEDHPPVQQIARDLYAKS